MADKTERALHRRKNRKPQINHTILIMTIALFAYGLIMVFSASSSVAHYSNLSAYYYLWRQLIFGTAGIIAMVIISKIDYRFWYHPLVTWGSAAAVALMLIAVLVVGQSSNGAQRWIEIGPITIQPSEFAKFATVVLMAKLLSDFKGNIKLYFKGLVLMLLPAVISAGLVLLGDHLSGAIIIALTGIIMVYASGAKFKHILATGCAMLPIAAIAVILKPYRLKRITSFFDPFSDPRGDGWQVVQSLYTIGSGGLFGVGLGQSRQKHGFLPEPYTDFIFSVICEELGFVGALLVIAMFVILIVTGFKVALNAPDKFSGLLACGMISLIALQFVFNIAVVTSAMPCTGITLPFFSYGGTALLVNLMEVGMILSVSKHCDRRL